MLIIDSQPRANVISAFNETSRYLEPTLNIDNPLFDTMIPTIYPEELKFSTYVKRTHVRYFGCSAVLVTLCFYVVLQHDS